MGREGKEGRERIGDESWRREKRNERGEMLCSEFSIICSNHETTNYSHTDQYTLTGIYTQVYVQNIREQTCAYKYACVQ